MSSQTLLRLQEAVVAGEHIVSLTAAVVDEVESLQTDDREAIVFQLSTTLRTRQVVLHATGWDLIHSVMGLLRHEDTSSVYGAMILNAIAEHGHSREVYLAIMESLGAYRSEVARIQLIRMLSKVIPRLRSPMKFIPQCFTRLVQLLHEEPTADSDSDTDSDSPTTHSDSEEAGAADEHEQQPTQQRSRFAAASAPSAPRMAVPPLVVLLQPLLQFIAPFHKQVVEATASADAQQSLRQWVAGFLLSMMGRPAMCIDLNAPIAGQTLREALTDILGLLKQIGVTSSALLFYRPPPPPPVKQRKRSLRDDTVDNTAEGSELSGTDEEEESGSAAASEMNGGVEYMDPAGTLRRAYTLADPYPVDGVAGALYMLLAERGDAEIATLPPAELLKQAAWAAATLLRGPESEVAMKGFKLTETLLDRITEPVLTAQDISQHYVLEWCQALINVAVSVNHDGIRKQLFGRVMSVLDVSTEQARFIILLRLMQGCPFGPVLALLLNRVKKEIIKFWPHAAPVDAAAPAAAKETTTTTETAAAPQESSGAGKFASPSVVEFVRLGLQHEDVVPQIDVLTAAINLLRFLLIRDKENITGVRTDERVKQELAKLRGNIDGAMNEIKSQLAVCDATVEQDSAVAHRRQLLERNANLVSVVLDLLGMTVELFPSQ